MIMLKRLIISLIIFDNWLTNLTHRLFPGRWQKSGTCRQCGQCCREIYLTLTPGQIRSPLFLRLAIAWIAWVFDFIYLRTDYERYALVFTCRHLTAAGKCDNYFWRPNICRNYPLVDYFREPRFLPGCGYSAKTSAEKR